MPVTSIFLPFDVRYRTEHGLAVVRLTGDIDDPDLLRAMRVLGLA